MMLLVFVSYRVYIRLWMQFLLYEKGTYFIYHKKYGNVSKYKNFGKAQDNSNNAGNGTC